MALGLLVLTYQNGQAGRVKVIGVDRYEYSWDIDTPSIPSDGNYYATVTGADLSMLLRNRQHYLYYRFYTTCSNLTDTDADNIISTTLSPTNTVTITASFSKSMAATQQFTLQGKPMWR